MMKKKILYISDYSFEVPGGAQKSMEIIMNGLSGIYDFYVLMPGKLYSAHNNNFTCICLESFEDFLVNKSLFQTIRILKEFKRIIEQIKPDIIHAHMVSGMSALEVLKKMGLVHCPIIYTERGVANQYSKITMLLIKMMVHDFDKVVVTTNYNYNLYQQKYGADDKKMVTIPNTAGPQFEKYEPQKKALIKRQMGFQRPVVMFNARLTYNKNWDLSLEIIKWLNEKFEYDFLVVVGSDRTSEDIERCKQLIDSIETIIGTKGKLKTFIDVSLDELSDIYYAADIFIMTSRSESFGRTAIEAMSRGLVVFGTNIDGLAEVIGNEKYKFNDISEFKEKFYKYISFDQNRESEFFLDRFRTKYSLNINVDSYNSLYNEVLSN